MYPRARAHTHTHTHTQRPHTHTHTHTPARTHTHATHIHRHTTHEHTLTQTHTQTHTHTHTYKHTCAHTHAYTQTHTHTHTYAHTHKVDCHFHQWLGECLKWGWKRGDWLHHSHQWLIRMFDVGAHFRSATKFVFVVFCQVSQEWRGANQCAGGSQVCRQCLSGCWGHSPQNTEWPFSYQHWRHTVVCVCRYLYVCVCVCVCVSVCVCVCVCVHVCVYMCFLMCMCVHLCVCLCLSCVCICMFTWWPHHQVCADIGHFVGVVLAVGIPPHSGEKHCHLVCECSFILKTLAYFATGLHVWKLHHCPQPLDVLISQLAFSAEGFVTIMSVRSPQQPI